MWRTVSRNFGSRPSLLLGVYLNGTNFAAVEIVPSIGRTTLKGLGFLICPDVRPVGMAEGCQIPIMSGRRRVEEFIGAAAASCKSRWVGPTMVCMYIATAEQANFVCWLREHQSAWHSDRPAVDVTLSL